MQQAKVLLSIGAVVMTITIVYGIIGGGYFVGFWEEAKVMLPLAWFHVAMIDLYLGFFIFAGWIAYRENSTKRTIGFIALLCVTGNVFSCIYALVALVKSGGDMQKFWMGNRAPGAIQQGA